MHDEMSAIYLWDYFYAKDGPVPGDERTWRLIENATCRMWEAEPHVRATYAPEIQLAQARRLRRDCRAARRQIALLSARPPGWVMSGLVALEVLADRVVRELGRSVSPAQLH
ncbi:MAG: hypothetical protein R3B06_03570 [Kofleriaceae bacterium]